MNSIWKVAFILSVAGSVAAQHKAQATSFAHAEAAAEANMQTSEGVKYDDQLETQFWQKHSGDVELCRKKLRAEYGFEIVLKVDNNGNAIEILARPFKKMSACIRAAILKDKFPIPPWPDYWVKLEIATCRICTPKPTDT
jgi:hypothetical protein